MNSIRRQSFFNLIITYTGFFISLFNSLFRVRVITAEQIGVISLIISISSIANYFVLFGTPNILLRFLPKYDKKEQSGIILFTLFINLFLFIVFTVVFLIFKEQMVLRFNNELFEQYYNYIFMFTFSSSFFQFFDVLLRTKFKSVYPSVIKDIYLKIVHLLLILIVLLARLEFVYYINTFFIINLSTLVILLIYFSFGKNITIPSINFIKNKDYISFFSYSFFIFFAGLAGTVVTQIDKIMLSYYSTLEFTGIYTIAIAIGGAIGLIGAAISKVTHPLISKNFVDNDMRSLERNYKSVGELQIAMSFYLFVLLIFLGNPALGFLGTQYKGSYWVVLIIAFSQMINLGTSTCGGIIVLSKYYKFDFISRIFLLVLNVVMNFLLIPLWGINGAAIATAASMFLYNVMKVVFVYNKFRIVPFTFQYLKVIISAFLLGGILYLYHIFCGQYKFYLILLLGVVSCFIFYYFLILLHFNNSYFNSFNVRIKSFIWSKK